MRLSVLNEWAFDRDGFQNRLFEKLNGALREHYKAECAKANGLTKWVQHWTAESRRLLGEFEDALRAVIRGFKDKRRAAEQMVVELHRQDVSHRRSAVNTIKRDYQVTKLKHKIPADTGFYRRVREIMDEVLGKEELG